MKKLSLALCALVLVACAPTPPQSARDAYVALKGIEGRTQAGVNYVQYMEAVGGSMGPANLFLESKEAAKFPELAGALRGTRDAYVAAGLVWRTKISGGLLGMGELAAIRERLVEIDPTYKKITAIQDEGKKLEMLREYHARMDGLAKNTDHELLLQTTWRMASESLKAASELLGG